MRNIFIIIFLFIDFSLFSKDVIVYGKIAGSNKKTIKVSIERTDDIVFSQNSIFQYPTKIKLKTNEKGEFHFVINDVKGFLYFNTLRISNKTIYFGIENGDSLYINYDSEHDSVFFSGDNSEKNYFINFYFSKVFGERFKTFRSNDINDVQKIKGDYNNYIEDSTFLELYSKKLRYCDNLVKYLQFIISNTILNDLLRTKINSSILIPYKYLIDSFNISNRDFVYDYYYLSTLTLYYEYKSGEILNICNNLSKSLELSKYYLNDTIRQFQNVYLIGYIMWYCTNDKENIKREINSFLLNNNHEYLKDMIRKKAKLKGLIN